MAKTDGSATPRRRTAKPAASFKLYHWTGETRSRRTGQMFLEFGQAAQDERFTGGIAVAITEGNAFPLVATEGALMDDKLKAAGALMFAAMKILADDL